MTESALVILCLAALFSVTLSAWTHVARAVDIHTVPARYRRRVLWWQTRAHHAQLVAVAVVAVSASVYVTSTFV